jgi:Zn-dependent protease
MIDNIFYIVILVMSVVVHEVSHGFMAEFFGDETAKYSGRLTLNPISHLDIFGSILIPAILVLSHSQFLFGWAKPVPYNEDNLSNKRWGTFFVAIAGVLANFLIAIIFGLIIRFTLPLNFSQGFYFITATIVIVNLALGLFNLIPIPPLDGSKILFSLLPESLSGVLRFLEKFSFVLIFLSSFRFSI